MKHQIMVSPEARKQLSRIPQKQKENIIGKIKELEIDPYTPRPGADIKLLRGLKGPDLHRLRAGSYRIIYEVSEQKVWISEILKRGGAYKFLI